MTAPRASAGGSAPGSPGSSARSASSGGDTRETETDLDGAVISVGAFLAGVYAFGRHFGRQAELGLDVFHAPLDEDGERTFGRAGTYTALSGVLRC